MEPSHSSRMSFWDIPHVPPETDPAQAPETPSGAAVSPAPTPPADEGEDRSLPEVLSPQREGLMAGPDPAGAQVRFLNAVVDDGPSLRVTVGNRLLSSSLSPGALSEFFPVAAGFRPFAFYDAQRSWMLLFRAAIPLSAGDRVTLALVRSGNGVDLVRVDDRPCGVQGTGRGCLRCANLCYNSPGLDLILTDGRVIFTDMRFKEATNYRRAMPGRYDLYIAQAPSLPPPSLSDIETVEELPMVVVNWTAEPLASFFLDLRAGEQASVYLLGNWAASGEIQVLPVKNF